MSIPRSPTLRENPIYFGIFSDPSTSAFVTTEEALATLSDVARNVEAKIGSRKRRSFREFLTDTMKRGSKKDRTQSCSMETEEEIVDLTSDERLVSLVRSASLDPKSGVDMPEASSIRQSVSTMAVAHIAVDEHKPVDVHKAVGDRKAVGANLRQSKIAPSAMTEMKLQIPKSPPLYYNDSISNLALIDRPPLPPERNQSSQLRKEDLKKMPSIPTNQLRGRRLRSEQERNSSSSELSHIPHRVCKLSNVDEADIVILYGDGCEVSEDWCNYFRRLFANDQRKLRIVRQSLETLSVLLNSLGHEKSSRDLERLEERTFHAKVQILLLGPKFLDWVWRFPGLIIGNLLDPRKLIPLLLGIEVGDIREQHRASFLTFSLWKTVAVEANSPGFVERIFAQAMSILSQFKPRRPQPVIVNGSRRLQEEPLRLEIRPKKVGILQRSLFLFPTENVGPAEVSISFEEDSGETTRILLDNENVDRLNDQAMQIVVPLEVFVKANVPKVINVELMSANDDRVLLYQGTAATESWDGDLRRHVLDSLSSVPSLNCLFSATFAQNSDELDAKLSNLVSAISIPPDVEKISLAKKEREGEGSDLPTLLQWAAYHKLTGLCKTLQQTQKAVGSNYVNYCETSQLTEASSFTKVESRSAVSLELTSHFASVVESQCENENVSQGTAQNLIAEQSSQEESIYDVPRHPFEGNPAPFELGYLPMQQISEARRLEESKKTTPIKRSCSASVVYIPPSVVNVSLKPSREECLDAKRLPFGGSDESSLSFLDLEMSRPQSRQEILNNFCQNKVDGQRIEREKQVTVVDEEPVKELWGLRTFSPPNFSFANTAATCRKSLFETCQAELIDLQHQFKREMLSLKEVEEKFESWKRRPELPLAKDRRQEELEKMREEWLRLQQLAEVKDREERKVWGLLRGFMTRKGARRKTSSGCSLISNSSLGEETLAVSSPERGEGDIASPVMLRTPKDNVCRKYAASASPSFCNKDYDIPRKLSLDPVAFQQFPSRMTSFPNFAFEKEERKNMNDKNSEAQKEPTLHESEDDD